MKIGIDIDGTINNLCEAVLIIYNHDSGDNLSVFDITSYYVENFVKPEFKNNFYKYYTDKRVWKLVKINELAKEIIKKLDSEKHEIYFVTSTEPENLFKKSGWLQRHFPSIDIRKRLIRCYNKQLLSGLNVLVDDYEKNLIGGSYKKILINKPWNQNIDDRYFSINRVENWKDIYDLLS